jgi:hypothetical protein
MGAGATYEEELPTVDGEIVDVDPDLHRDSMIDIELTQDSKNPPTRKVRKLKKSADKRTPQQPMELETPPALLGVENQSTPELQQAMAIPVSDMSGAENATHPKTRRDQARF